MFTDRSLCALVLGWAVCSTHATRVGAQDDVALTEQFRVEAPKKWAEYRSFAKCVQGGWESTQFDRINHQKLDVAQRHMKQHGGWLLSIEHQPGHDGQLATASAVNSSYAFEVKRRSPDGPWFLTGLDMNLQAGASTVYGLPNDSAVRIACIGQAVYNVHLPDLVKEPGFSLKRVSSQDADSSRLVRIEFDRSSDDLRNNPGRGGWVLLDPAQYWLIKQYEVKAVWPDGDGTISATLEYKTTDDGFPIATRVVRYRKAITHTGMTVDHEDVMDYDLNVQAKVPEREFMLSAFGLPEPAGSTPSRRYLWIGGAGLLCVAVAVWLARRARSARTSV